MLSIMAYMSCRIYPLFACPIEPCAGEGTRSGRGPILVISGVIASKGKGGSTTYQYWHFATKIASPA